MLSAVDDGNCRSSRELTSRRDALYINGNDDQTIPRYSMTSRFVHIVPLAALVTALTFFAQDKDSALMAAKGGMEMFIDRFQSHF